MRNAEHTQFSLICAGGAALGAKTQHIVKIERGAGPRHWEAANKKSNNNQRMRLAARGGTEEGTRNRMATKNEATKNIKH